MEWQKFLFLFYTLSKKNTKNKLITYISNKSFDDNLVRICCKSGLSINQAEDDSEEDCELLAELARLLEHEEK